ncbi:MAG TPA: transposase [Ktedonobacteraceae bacterium]|nr:transposase [Ktedonobacteraceae bacterium]
MTEYITSKAGHYTPAASLAALGVKLQQVKLFEPIERLVHIAQKTVKYSPVDKLYDSFIAMLAGAHGMVEINTRLRSDPALQAAFGRFACAEQSVVQQTLDACTDENVTQMQQAMDEIYRGHSAAYRHDYRSTYQILDMDMSGMPCGPKAALATKGYFPKQRNRRGRQLGRVVASLYDEVVVDRLFDGKTQLTKALQPLMEAAEQTLDLTEDKRRRTIVRVDAGGGSLDDVNWMLARGYLVHTKDYSGKSATKLAKSVTEWFDDPTVAGRQFGLVTEPALCYVRPVTRIAVRYPQRNGKWKAVVLISALSAQHVLALTGEPQTALSDQATVLRAYVHFYDQRGAGVETSFKGDKSGLGLTKRSKKRFPAQHMLVLLGSLVHNVIVWARGWLAESTDKLSGYGMLRMVRDVFHVSGLVLFDQAGHVQQIILNQHAPFARFLFHSLRDILSPLHISVHLGQT